MAPGTARSARCTYRTRAPSPRTLGGWVSNSRIETGCIESMSSSGRVRPARIGTWAAKRGFADASSGVFSIRSPRNRPDVWDTIMLRPALCGPSAANRAADQKRGCVGGARCRDLSPTQANGDMRARARGGLMKKMITAIDQDRIGQEPGRTGVEKKAGCKLVAGTRAKL